MGVSTQEYINRYGRRPGQSVTSGGASYGSLSQSTVSGSQLVSVKIEGFDELARKLRELVPAMRRRVLGNALRAGARVIRDEAKRNAPMLSHAAKAPYRKPGTLKGAIRVRTSKQARRAGDVGVFVNVRPAKSGARGAKSPTDPFYWRWLEFGTRKLAAVPFLKPAGDKLPQALKVFETQVGRWIEKVNASGKITP